MELQARAVWTLEASEMPIGRPPTFSATYTDAHANRRAYALSGGGLGASLGQGLQHL
jgi:hypothetical protein